MGCAATVSALATGLTLAAAEPVVVGTDAPFAPYTLIDAAGTITGFERDVMDEICARAALRCTWVDATFGTLIPGVMAGEFDVVLGGMGVTPERRRLVDFSHSYHATDDEEWFIGRPGAPPPETAVTAVQAGTLHHDYLAASGSRFMTFATEEEVLETLQRGQADLAFGPFERDPEIGDQIEAAGFAFLYSVTVEDDGVAMAVCKGNRELLDSLNTAIDGMTVDGTLAALRDRWFQ
jgi:ABC-type amino acid transport substrate-binding protein